MARPEKVEAVARMKQLFEESGSYFVTDYQGLNVADMTALRRDLSSNNVKYLIGKNTLLHRAATESGQEGLDGFLKGPTAIAFTKDDPSVAAKILYDSFKERELPRIKVFVVDKHMHDAADIKRLAELPPREILLSQLVAAVESPLTSLVGSLDGFFRELVGTLDALADKKKSEG